MKKTFTLLLSILFSGMIYCQEPTSPVNNGNAAEFSISPNPSKGIVEVRFSKMPVDTYINVYDLMGTQLISHIEADKLHAEIDMSGQQPGTYFVEITDGEKTSVRKVVKE